MRIVKAVDIMPVLKLGKLETDNLFGITGLVLEVFST